MTKTKRIILITGATLCILIIALVGAGEYFLSVALTPDNENYSVEREFTKFKRDYPWAAQWGDSIRSTGALRDTVIANADGLKMHGWYLAAAKDKANTAVIVHGYTANPFYILMIGYLYNHDMGWNILLPDLPAHGQSEGDYIQMGWYDRHAVSQWIDVAHNIFRSDTMVVHGISMGAATTMCVAGDPTPDYVRAFVADCGYTSVWDQYKKELAERYGLPAFPILHIASLLCRWHHGWSFTEASPINQVKKCTKPMLFIHGGNDTYVPTSMVYPLYEAHPAIDSLWIAPGSAHAESYKDHPDEYTRTVKDFIDKNIR